MSTKIKLASMLFCSGKYAAAAQVLTHCEGLLGPDVAHYCGYDGRRWRSKCQ